MSSDPFERFFSVIVYVNAVVVVSGMAVSWLLRRRIAALKPEALDGFDYSIGGGIAYTRYLFGSGHRALQDPTVDRLAFAYKILLCTVIGLLFVGLVVTFWPLATGRVKFAVDPARGHPLNAYGAAILVSLGLYFALYSWFCRYLRRAHGEIWQRLGRPSLIMNNTPVTAAKAFGFIWSAQHHDIADPKLSRAIYAIRLANFVLLASMIFFRRWV